MSSDIDIAHRRRWPGRPMNLATRLWLVAISPGLQILLAHRIIHWTHSKRKNDLNRKWFWRTLLIPLELLKLATRINAKSAIHKDSELEQGISFSDLGHIMFGPQKTGARTVIGPRVTVGMNHTDIGRPEIGRKVWIGSDCIIYGAIRIGDGATLLPGTVLTKSIPAGVVMQGNPARLVLRNFDNSALLENQDADVMHHVNMKRGG